MSGPQYVRWDEEETLNKGLDGISSPPGAGASPQTRGWSTKKKAWVFGGGAVVALALIIGLAVGLSDNGGSGSSTALPGPSGSPSPSPSTTPSPSPSGDAPPAEVPAGLESVPEACHAPAMGAFYESLNPSDYHLTVTLPAEHFVHEAAGGTFNATAALNFTVSAATSCVVLHARNLTFSSITLEGGAPAAAGGGGRRMLLNDGPADDATALCANVDECAEKTVFPFEPAVREKEDGSVIILSQDHDLVAIYLGGAALAPGSSPVLRFTYTGKLGGGADGTGLFHSEPFTVAAEGVNATEVLAVTQLERWGARALLPCYDMPAYKATYHVTAVVPEGKTVLSNGVGAASAPAADGLVTWNFTPTPPMSSYLLALVAGSLVKYTGGTEDVPAPDGYNVTAWAVPGSEERLLVAQTAAHVALTHFADYFKGVDQPVKNYDIVAVPWGFGAMENWGLLTFDADRLLVTDKTGDGSYAFWRAINVVCHEMAHQWWGNVAGPADWRQLSLIEGIASYLEYNCTEKGLAALLDNGLGGDANVTIAEGTVAAAMFFRTTSPTGEAIGHHEGPLVQALQAGADPLADPLVPWTDTNATFDSIPYAKGAAFARQLKEVMDTMRPGLFQEGLVSFLKRQAGQNPQRNGTWAHLMVEISEPLVAEKYYLHQAARASGSPDNLKPCFPAFAVANANFTKTNLNSNAVYERSRHYAAAWAESFQAAVAHATATNTPSRTGGLAPIGAWFHKRALPYLTPGLMYGGNDAAALVPGDMALTGTGIGLSQRAFCAWRASSEDGKAAAGAADAEDLARSTCDDFAENGTVRVRWPIPTLMDNLTDCGVADATISAMGYITGTNATTGRAVSWAGDTGRSNISATAWVNNHGAARLYRSYYGDDHLEALRAKLGTLGSAACGDADPVDILEAAAMVGDSVYLALAAQDAPAKNNSASLVNAAKAVQAALQADATVSDTGMYVLAVHALDGLAALRWAVQEDADAACRADLAAFAVKAAKNVSAALGQVMVSIVSDPTGVESIPLLTRLATPRLRWRVSTLGAGASDEEVACLLLVRNTTLNAYLDPPSPAVVANAANASAATPAGSFAAKLNPPADSRSFIYISAAANISLAGNCPPDAVEALKRCWANETEYSDARRCLHALAFAHVTHAEDVAAWLWDGAVAALDGADAPRAAARRRQLAKARPTLLATLAEQSAAHWGFAFAAATNTTRFPEGSKEPCAYVDLLPAAPTAAALKAVLAWVAGAGRACPGDVRLRAVGRADQLQSVRSMDNNVNDFCAFLKAASA